MGVTAAIVIGVDKASGGAITSTLAGKPPKMDNAPATTPTAPAAEAAAKRQDKKNQAAYGRSDTILTGPQGVLGSSPTPGAAKTLLGS